MFDRILVYSVVICYRRVKDPFESAGAERGCFESVAVFVLPTSESSGQIKGCLLCQLPYLRARLSPPHMMLKVTPHIRSGLLCPLPANRVCPRGHISGSMSNGRRSLLNHNRRLANNRGHLGRLTAMGGIETKELNRSLGSLEVTPKIVHTLQASKLTEQPK
jgi:hypothetical protein